MTVLVVAEAVVIGLLGILVVGLLRRNAAILREFEEGKAVTGGPGRAGTGALARDIAGVGLNGQIVGVRVREPDRPTLLAFMSTTCSTCNHFWRGFGDAEMLATLGSTRLIIITYGDGHERPAAIAEVAPPDVPLVMSSIAWQTYDVPSSPHFVMISEATGLITAKASAPNWDEMLQLIGLATGA
ncbi:hypothetical protein ACFLRH_00285 [Actinomycetota bacterium]